MHGKGGAKVSSGQSSASTASSQAGSDANKAEDYLNSILPPREYSDGGQLWVQYVSPRPATRLDVAILQDELDKKLQERQARETGICPIREELFSQAFDELIRQATINCAERGFLLVRVRDEIKMTIQAYQTLYESSIAYGMRKTLQAEQGKAEKLQHLDALKRAIQDHIDHIHDLSSMIQMKLEHEQNFAIEATNGHNEQMKRAKAACQAHKDDLTKKLKNVAKGND